MCSFEQCRDLTVRKWSIGDVDQSLRLKSCWSDII